MKSFLVHAWFPLCYGLNGCIFRCWTIR